MTNKTNKSFIIHKDSLSILDQLSDEQAGKLFKAIYSYQKIGEIGNVDQIISIALNPFLNQFERDKRKYENVIERNKNNIAKRWNKFDTKNTTGKFGIPNYTKNTDNKNDSDSKNDSKNDSDILEKKIIKKKRFIKPTLEEIRNYCLERKSNVDAKQFFEYYENGDWSDSKGNKVKNWKQKFITWEKRNFSSSNQTNFNNTRNYTDEQRKALAARTEESDWMKNFVEEVYKK